YFVLPDGSAVGGLAPTPIVFHLFDHGFIDPVSQSLTGFEMRNALAFQEHWVAGPGIATEAGGTKMAGKTAEVANLDALSLDDRVGQHINEVFDGEVHVLGGELLVDHFLGD